MGARQVEGRVVDNDKCDFGHIFAHEVVGDRLVRAQARVKNAKGRAFAFERARFVTQGARKARFGSKSARCYL